MKKGGGNYRPSKNILKAKLAHANCLSKHTLFGSTLKGRGGGGDDDDGGGGRKEKTS